MVACNGNCSKTLKDWYDTSGDLFKMSCKEKIDYMNDILELMWIDTYELRNFWRYHKIPAGNWIQTITTNDPIYSVEWFYGKVWSQCPQGLWQEIDSKRRSRLGNCCCKDMKEIFMYDMGAMPIEDLQEGQYVYCRDTKEMHLRLPCGVENVFIKYFAGFSRLENLTDCIPIEPGLFPALKLLMRAHYADDSGAAFSGDDSKYISRYEQFIDKLKTKDAPRMKQVEFWDGY